MAKPAAGTYEPNKRVMLKVKHERDCDCVVAGFRWHKNGEGTAVGSLLLGLYDDAGNLAARRRLRELHRRRSAGSSSTFLAPYRENALDGHPWRAWAEADASDGRGAAPARARRAAGARARICRGSRCARSWSSRSRTITCRARASATRRSFGAGAPTSARRTAPSRSSRSCRRRSWRRSSTETRVVRRQRDRDCSSRSWLRFARCSRHSRVGSSSGSGVSCGGPIVLRHVAQVDADARPRRRPAAHRVDQHVVDREVRRGLGMPRLPALEAGERGVLVGRVRDDDERHLRARASSAAPSPRPSRATARRAAPRLPSCGSAAATARRRVRRPRRAPRARAARRASRRVVHRRRADRRSSAKRAGIVSTVKSAGSQSGTSSQCERRRDARVGERPHRVGRAGRAVLGVLVVVEEDAVALLLPPLRRRERRQRAARSRARTRARRAAPR